jgi:hypothetical protein
MLLELSPAVAPGKVPPFIGMEVHLDHEGTLQNGFLEQHGGTRRFKAVERMSRSKRVSRIAAPFLKTLHVVNDWKLRAYRTGA